MGMQSGTQRDRLGLGFDLIGRCVNWTVQNGRIQTGHLSESNQISRMRGILFVNR